MANTQNFEVKYFYNSDYKTLGICEQNHENQIIKGKTLAEKHSNAFLCLQEILKNLIENKILFFKNYHEDIFKPFDEKLIKNENGDFDLSKIHQFPQFFNDGIIKISLLFEDKEIYRIGNIRTFDEYVEILENSKNLSNKLQIDDSETGFHTIQYKKFYLFDKKIRELKKMLQPDENGKEELWFSVPDYSVLEDFTIKNIEKNLLALHNSNGGVLFFENTIPSMDFYSEHDTLESLKFIQKIHPEIQLEINQVIDIETDMNLYEAVLVKKGKSVLKSSFGEYFFRNHKGVFVYDESIKYKDLRIEKPMSIDEIKEILKLL